MQRQAEEPEKEEEEEEKPIAAQELPTQTPYVSPGLDSRIQSLKGGGQSLPDSARSYFEPRIGYDFSQVRVHTDSQAAETARTVNAQAFTVGSEVVFVAGQFAPQTNEGRRLIAHELTHVVQQGGQMLSRPGNLRVTRPSDAAEREARAGAAAVASGEAFRPRTTSSVALARQVDAGVPSDAGVPLDAGVSDSLRDEGPIAGTSGPSQAPTPATPPAPTPSQVQAPPPALVIDQPAANTRFYIDATPQMPTINCRARITGATPDPTATTMFDWEASTTETVTKDSCASSKIGNCTSPPQKSSIVGGNLTPVFSDIQGGEITISARAKVGLTHAVSSSVVANILARNPGAAAITTRCGGAGSDTDQIACRESGRSQFNAAGDHPVLGPGGDVGVMQLCNPAASCLQRWDWTTNVDAGLALFAQKQAAARRYLNQHRVQGNYPNSLNLNNADVLRREAIQRYNGGCYWEWNADTNRWVPNPPNNYVSNVLAC